MEEPTYLIKSRSGETLIQGTPHQVSEWIKERRITTNDELKRQGWVLYEKDEAWAAISAFPEFSGPSAHAHLLAMRRQNLWILSAAVVFILLGLILIAVNFLMPAYDASKRIEASMDAERNAVIRMQEASEVAKAAEAEAVRQKAIASRAEESLGAQVKEVRAVRAELAGLHSRLESIKTTMPIVVRWRESLINSDQVVAISNTSDNPLKLLVSIYDANGVQTKRQFSLTLEPAGLTGSTKESGVGESIKHYFKKGESVEFTDVDAVKDFRYRPVRIVSP